MVVAAQHADAGLLRVAAVVLQIEAPGRLGVPDNLVHALAELGIRVGVEPGADALVLRLEGLASVLAQVVAAGRDGQMQALAVGDDGVQAEAARLVGDAARASATAR